MKRVIIAVLLFACSTISLLAASHTVIRGESLQSIAAKYNITTEQLLAANPGADQLFYVGLKLTIPENTAQPVSLPTPENTIITSSKVSTTEKQYETVTNETDDKPNLAVAMMIEWGFLPKPKIASSGSGTNMAFTIGANYFFMHENSGLFAGARIGYDVNYQLCTFKDKFSTIDYKKESHYISLPINAGYAFTTSNKTLGIIPFAGIDMNFCVAGKAELNKQKQNFKKRTAIDARIGVQLRFGDFNIGGSYIIPLNEKSSDIATEDDGNSFFAVNIGWGF